jgi:hypothetical protein
MVVIMKNIPAFPVFPETGGGHAAAFKGMTLRDYFAAKALQGLLTSEDIDVSYATAVLCYRMADAMMKARDA